MQEAEKSLKFYRNVTTKSDKEAMERFNRELTTFKANYQWNEQCVDDDKQIVIQDFCKHGIFPLFSL